MNSRTTIMNQEFMKLDRFDGTSFVLCKDKMMLLLSVLKISYIVESVLSPLSFNIQGPRIISSTCVVYRLTICQELFNLNLIVASFGRQMCCQCFEWQMTDLFGCSVITAKIRLHPPDSCTIDLVCCTPRKLKVNLFCCTPLALLISFHRKN